MSRTIRDATMDSRAARLRLVSRPKPYWRLIETGLHLGYRRVSEGGGTWIARRFTADRRYRETKLGRADDYQDADGASIQSYRQALDLAREWWKAEQRKELGLVEPSGPYTVNAALDDYLAERERRGSKGVRADRYATDARIRPALGEIEVGKLTTARIRQWQSETENAPKLRRSRKGSSKQRTAPIDTKDAEAVRARKATANRLLTVLKAALNFAFQEGRVAADEAWRKVKPAKEVDTPVVQFLSPVECVRLVNACQGNFRDLVRGALVTGCRYGELCRLKVADFSQEAGSIHIRLSKAGKTRHVALNVEGRALFANLTAGRQRGDLVFVRDDGKAWGPSHQQRPLEEASKAARLDPPATFHILRHTYASALAARSVPMRVIADQLGHADTRMTERHYAHLSPSHVADVVRAALPGFGIMEPSNVVEIAR